MNPYSSGCLAMVKRVLLVVACMGLTPEMARAQGAPEFNRALTQTPGGPVARRPGVEMLDSANQASGWRFSAMPRVDAVDDKSGAVRFRIVVDATGVIQTVAAVSSTVSARQEVLCREALLRSSFERVGVPMRGATGYYTFRFTGR